MEACKSEYQSFVQEQRELEPTSNRERRERPDFLLFTGWLSCAAPLYKVRIVSKRVSFNLAATSGSFMFCFRSFNKQHLPFVKL